MAVMRIFNRRCLMKKFFTLTSALLALSLGFISCNKEVKEGAPEGGYRYQFTILDDNTKATLDNNGVAWEASDRVGMFLEGYTGYANVNMETTPRSVILYSPKEIPANSYAYAYYPYNTSNDDKEMTLITLSNVQQGGSNSAMPMAGLPFKVETAAEASSRPNGSIQFMNLGAIIDFKVFSDSYDDETIQYVTFKANDAVVSGGAFIDLTAIKANDESTLSLVWMGGENEFDYVKVNQEVAVASSKDDAPSIYMVVAPGTYSGTITIGTDVATYTFNFSNKALARNVLKHYNMNLDNATREAGVHETVMSLPYNEAFTTGIGEFVTEEPVPASAVGAIWTQSSTYGMIAKAATGSGDNVVNYASEAWLISPWIDLTEVNAAVASFDHVHRYAGTATNELTFWVMTDDADAEWTKLTIPSYAPGNNWTFVNSGTINLTPYAGKKVKVAFKYISSTQHAATWEVKNFKVEEVVLTTEFTIAAESITVQVGKTKNNPVTVNSGATISYSSADETIATVDEEGNVTGVSVGETSINVSVPAYNGYPAKQASYDVTVVAAEEEKNFTWDLSKASYDSATDNAIVWSNDNVTMQNAKGTGTAPNNYIPPTRTSTRFYGGNILTITPKGTCEISKIEFTATSDSYATALKGSTWTNASAAADGTTVTVTPIDGTNPISATVGGTCGLTAVKVYYTGGTTVVVTEYTVSVSETTNGTVVANPTTATQGTEISLTITPDTDYELDVLTVVDASNNQITVTNNKFIMPASNVVVTATFKLIQTGGPTTYTMTIDSAAGTNGTCDVTWKDAETTSVEHEGITWSTTVEGDPAFQGSNNDCKIGSKNNPATQIRISTTGFAGKKIKSASLTGYCTNTTGPVLTITAGATTMLSATDLVKTTSTTYSSTTNDITLGSSDALVFEINSSVKAGIVISKIEVVYE